MSLLDLFRERNKSIYTLKCPFKIQDESDSPKEISGAEAFKFLSDSKKENICSYFENSNLQQYLEGIGKTIIKLEMTFIETGVIHVAVSVKEDLFETEKEELLKFIQGQLSDGWGEDDFGFNRNGTTYNLLF